MTCSNSREVLAQSKRNRQRSSLNRFDIIIIKPQTVTHFLLQIVQHCIDLTDLAILHRDLKDENVLVNTSDLSVKIIDFGCACQYQRNEYTIVAGTPEFFPPEMYTQNGYNGEPLNAWSIGMIIYILVMGDVPFDTDREIVMAKRTKVSLLTVLSILICFN